MDTAITSLAMENKSTRLEIAGFQSCVTGLKHQMVTTVDLVHTVLDKDQELLFLRSKLIDLEDRSQRDILPKLTEIVFKLLLEFQRAHSLGPKRKLCPIIACLLRHEQVRQLLSVSRAHRPFKTDDSEIRITGDFSKEANECLRGFLALQTRMRQLEVCETMDHQQWISKNFYDQEDLQIYLDSLQSQSMDTMDSDRPLRPSCDNRDTSLPLPSQERPGRF
ncbi:hypothetical protein NDU88_001230 [Pleurodeles waltl]|uniref:Uncharacterized protein n=1 Tax=Pleurodeles waltl TaxID=8319 RepID=A0AAV7VVV3_PLEWA|nr:hypothetical protein NDU88_001230 [Pleurodeles waltl]